MKFFHQFNKNSHYIFKNSKKKPHDSMDFKRVLSEDTPFAVTEAYRSLYTNVLYLPVEGHCKKIAITSANPGEGKTSLAVNLSYSIALNSPESKVLLINADMRSPRMCALLKIKDRGHGLSEFLAGIDEVPQVTESKIPNLHLITSGAGIINSMGLLASKNMGRLCEYYTKNYDYVIIDTPPINAVSDALLLKDCVNGYILVSRANYSDINSVCEAYDILKNAGAQVFGSVLMCYEPKGDDRYKRYGHYEYQGKKKK